VPVSLLSRLNAKAPRPPDRFLDSGPSGRIIFRLVRFRRIEYGRQDDGG
jgi:hypothetical protein